MTNTLGQKIKKLRENSNFTQEQIAEYLKINRVSFANIEGGSRQLKSNDPLLDRIADLFEIDKNELINHNTVKEVKVISDKDKHKKMKNLILYILDQCGQKQNVGKTVLNKLLYFSDFNYFEYKWESITNHPYIKFPRGPVPRDIDDIMQEMEENNQITKIETIFGGYKQIRFIPNIKYDIDEFSSLAVKVIDEVIDKLSAMTANQITEYSHSDIPFIVTKNLGEEINYKHAFSRVGEYIANPDNDD